MTPPFIDDLLADSSFAVRLIPGLPSGSHDAAAGSGSLPRVPVEPVAVSGSHKRGRMHPAQEGERGQRALESTAVGYPPEHRALPLALKQEASNRGVGLASTYVATTGRGSRT